MTPSRVRKVPTTNFLTFFGGSSTSTGPPTIRPFDGGRDRSGASLRRRRNVDTRRAADHSHHLQFADEVVLFCFERDTCPGRGVNRLPSASAPANLRLTRHLQHSGLPRSPAPRTTTWNRTIMKRRSIAVSSGSARWNCAGGACEAYQSGGALGLMYERKRSARVRDPRSPPLRTRATRQPPRRDHAVHAGDPRQVGEGIGDHFARDRIDAVPGFDLVERFDEGAQDLFGARTRLCGGPRSARTGPGRAWRRDLRRRGRFLGGRTARRAPRSTPPRRRGRRGCRSRSSRGRGCRSSRPATPRSCRRTARTAPRRRSAPAASPRPVNGGR